MKLMAHPREGVAEAMHVDTLDLYAARARARLHHAGGE